MFAFVYVRVWLQGTDRWQSASLFDPTDAGAGGFYALSESHQSGWRLLILCH